VSHGVLKKGLKKHLNPSFLYRLGGLKNSTTMKQEPFFEENKITSAKITSQSTKTRTRVYHKNETRSKLWTVTRTRTRAGAGAGDCP